MSKFRECEICGAALDPSEKCDCNADQNDDLPVSAILCTQPPIIFENLESVKQNLEAVISEVSTLPADEESLKKVKKIRANLSKEFNSLDTQRKAVKQQVMEPYYEAESKFKSCISEPYKVADLALKKWVDDYQDDMKHRCELRLREYFDEFCTAEGIDFLKFEDCGVVVDMALARQKEPLKAIDRISDFICGVRADMDTIANLDASAAIFAEYKKCLNLSHAILAYNKRIAEESAADAAIDDHRKRQSQQEQTISEIFEAEPEIQQEEPEVYSVSFLATGTLPALKSMKAYALSLGITLEEIEQEEENE